MDELRVKFGEMTHEERSAASREREIEEWQSINRFCGKCGTAMRHHENPDEPAFVCPKCGYTAYPKIRYVRSQTWPFPSNIMIGFRAEYAAGEIHPDGKEVLASHWFDRGNLPEIPRKGSIARAMLDDWSEGRI